MNEPLYYAHITRSEYLDGVKNADILAQRFAAKLPLWRDDAGLQSSAYLGFVKAAQGFDRNQGWRWLTYLYPAVQRALNREWLGQLNFHRGSHPTSRFAPGEGVEPLLALDTLYRTDTGEYNYRDVAPSAERPVDDLVINRVHLEACFASLRPTDRLRIREWMEGVPICERTGHTSRQNTCATTAEAIHRMRRAYFGPVEEISLR